MSPAKTTESIEEPFVTDLGGSNEACITLGILMGKWASCNFWGLYGPLKTVVSHCCAATKISNGISATAAADCIVSGWPVSH